MNARLYDPRIGRFFSPDNYITDPENPQSYNRYSYALNNPLSYVDPSGNEVLRPDNLSGWQDGSMDIWMGGLTLSLLSIELDLPSNYLLDISKLEFYVTGNVFFTFAKYLLSPTGGWGERKKNEIIRKTKLPEDVIIVESMPVDQEQIIQDTYDEDRKKYEEEYPDGGVPVGTKIYVASGKYIAENSEFYKKEGYLLGLGKWSSSLKEIWLNSELYLGHVTDKHKYFIDIKNNTEYYNTLEVMTHEIGHFIGHAIYGDDYNNWTEKQRENQARRYTNIIRSKNNRPLEFIPIEYFYEDWWNRVKRIFK